MKAGGVVPFPILAFRRGMRGNSRFLHSAVPFGFAQGPAPVGMTWSWERVAVTAGLKSCLPFVLHAGAVVAQADSRFLVASLLGMTTLCEWPTFVDAAEAAPFQSDL